MSKAEDLGARYAQAIQDAETDAQLDALVGDIYTDDELSKDVKSDLKALVDARREEIHTDTPMKTGLQLYAERQRDKALRSMGIDPAPPKTRPERQPLPPSAHPAPAREVAVADNAAQVAAPAAKIEARSRVVSEGFQPKDIDAAKAAIKKDSRHELVVRDAAELYKVPPGFIIIFEDKLTGRLSPYIEKTGMLWKLKDHGFRSVQVDIVPDPDRAGGFLGEARIYPNLKERDYDLLQALVGKLDVDTFRLVYEDLMRPTVAHSSANEGNLKEKQRAWPREMCETRAVLRAARVFTGCGLSTPEEDQETGG